VGPDQPPAPQQETVTAAPLAGPALLPAGRVIAIAYASNAISASLPVVGSGAATAFSYRRLVGRGATPALAGWALTLAGIVSNAAFVVVISTGAIVSGNIAGVAGGSVGIALSALAVFVAVIAVRRATAREWCEVAIYQRIPSARRISQATARRDAASAVMVGFRACARWLALARLR
jgi:hypothetical protein